jgi:hypothetical protein
MKKKRKNRKIEKKIILIKKGKKTKTKKEKGKK